MKEKNLFRPETGEIKILNQKLIFKILYEIFNINKCRQIKICYCFDRKQRRLTCFAGFLGKTCRARARCERGIRPRSRTGRGWNIENILSEISQLVSVFKGEINLSNKYFLSLPNHGGVVFFPQRWVSHLGSDLVSANTFKGATKRIHWENLTGQVPGSIGEPFEQKRSGESHQKQSFNLSRACQFQFSLL